MTPKRFVFQLAKDLAGRILVYTGAHRRLLRGRAVVVAFHSIVPGQSQGALRCGAKDFERYCGFFAQYMRAEPFPRIAERLHGHEELNGEVGITFDDGYADNAEVAREILERYRLHATFFVSTGFIDSVVQTAWDSRANVRSRWMTWAQVRELADRGHEIGSHAVLHPNLGELDSDAVVSELERSSAELLARIGRRPHHFAVPFGRSYAALEDTVCRAREMGFRSVSLCRGGVADHVNSELCIERWPIDATAYLSPFGWIVDVVREVRLDRLARGGHLDRRSRTRAAEQWPQDSARHSAQP